ncbi:uncharacterized protein CC84DRAFT_1219270 [Paraphaeosphaeria sporulosa]|uniref:Uncharacterized protein n=1 Tax=Paraphaeosphaeria sporulosa TaxID=1460663 RepID=A0A177C9H9_9PLEO|nr:uncharacterized protein CC84DRAFT_1219270 [Paraphaeosphaeria sporulosa]OAG04036.1 hypothetical protein CC84DRAFT_1219270 [Paraphaeosphaeria sporulosa]
MKFIIATAALVATSAASNIVRRETTAALNAAFTASKPYAKVVNRCSYPVYLWSIEQEMGCDTEAGIVLKTGEIYHENFRSNAAGGVSIKLSKFDTCGGKDITQLEYKIVNDQPGYNGNYLDMSFVDCTDNIENCPGRTDGFYMKSGNEGGIHTSAVNNEHCPIFNVYDSEEAAKVSYINWNDRQTKYCQADANLQLFLCGGEAPGADEDTPFASSSASASSSAEIESSSAQPTSTSSSSEEAAPSTTEEANFVVAAAAAVTEAPAAPVIKTEVVYVTEFVKARHAHGRRHQHFHA